MATRLILIRHGSTNLNLEKRYCGLTDVALNKKGKQDIRKLAKLLKIEKIDRVYCSDRKRAIESAKIIFKGRDIKSIPALREMNFGIFEGLTYQEIMEKYPRVYALWLDNPFTARIPKGESLNKFKERILKSINRIISLNPNRTLAIICHGGPISILINSVLKAEAFWKYIPACATTSIIEYQDRKPKILVFNDARH